MTRQNYDKRSLRIMHATDFVRAIHADAASGELSDGAPVPDVEPLVWLRKRPLLPSEVTMGEFTSVSARVARGASVYDCRLTPDYKAGQMLQHEFPLPVLSQSNEEAVAQMQPALHRVRSRSSRCPGSCCQVHALNLVHPWIRWRLCNFPGVAKSRELHIATDPWQSTQIGTAFVKHRRACCIVDFELRVQTQQRDWGNTQSVQNALCIQLVETAACSSGAASEATCFMLGQTSAGKTHTMQALLQAVAVILESMRVLADGACGLECFELRGDTRGAVRDLLQSGEPGCVMLKNFLLTHSAGHDLSSHYVHSTR